MNDWIRIKGRNRDHVNPSNCHHNEIRAILKRLIHLTDIVRFIEKVGDPTETGCWPWCGSLVNIKKMPEGSFRWRGRSRPAHRVSYEIFNGEIPNGLQVLHKCDYHRCVNPGHLFLGTPQDNIRDKTLKGRSAKSKLKPNDIRNIRIDPRTHTEIGKDYGVDHSTIQHIKSGLSWSWVK